LPDAALRPNSYQDTSTVRHARWFLHPDYT
jgi:hypothetical protein